jgi:hypothetical protein
MASTKEQLVGTIKEWVALEQEISKLQKELKKRKEQKKELTTTLVTTMKTNEIDCFDINNGKIMYTTNKIKAPVNKKHLMDSITQYFEDQDSNMAEQLTKHILESRQVTMKDNIRLKEPKK